MSEALKDSAPRLVKIGDISSLTPPGIFVGTYNYPNVYAGPVAVADPSALYPKGNEYGKEIEEILNLGRNIYRASRVTSVRDVSSKFSQSVQESAMSSQFVDIEMKVSGGMNKIIDHDRRMESPMQSMVKIDALRMTSNPKIPRNVDYFHNDTDLLSAEAVWMLYENGLPIDYLKGVLSSGALGIGKNRRLVPTRWSITAVDDILYRKIRDELRTFDTISEVRWFKNSYLGNRFNILLLPYSFAFEMQELWTGSGMLDPESRVLMDYELSRGRKNYASNVGGAYYAARMAVMEYLRKIRRQASVLVLRNIGSEYYSPLGVWVVRETVRDAMSKGYNSYSSIEEAVGDIDARMGDWSSRSRILREKYIQKTIMEYF